MPKTKIRKPKIRKPKIRKKLGKRKPGKSNVALLAASLVDTVGDVTEGAQRAARTMKFLRKRVAAGGAALRTDVGEFFNGLRSVGQEAEKLGEHFLNVQFPIPSSGDETFAERLLEDAPDLVLFPIGKALEAVPGWSEKPGDIASELAALRQIPDERVDRALVLLTGSLQALSTLIEAMSELLPDDLSITVSIVGEGGGLEVCGNPSKFPFVAAKLRIDTIVILLETIQGLRAIG